MKKNLTNISRKLRNLPCIHNHPLPHTTIILTYYLSSRGPNVPKTARAVQLKLADRVFWWDKYFRFRMGEFFDDLLPTLDLPDSFTCAG